MIPILINNRDLLDSPRELVKFFRQVPEAYIVLCDNASTYPELREWLDFICSSPGAFPDLARPKHAGISIHWIFMNEFANKDIGLPDELWCFPENRGPRAASDVKNRLDFKFDYYFLCDSDLDFSDIDPKRLLPDLQIALDCMSNIQGAGVDLCLDDLPLGKMRDYVLSVERPPSPSDILKTDPPFYRSSCDTAGVLRRSKPAWNGEYNGVRSLTHIARHRPWYFIPENQPLPQCESCGYTHEDASIQMDHHLCVARGGKIPPGIRTPDDFKWFFEHAEGRGTCYTARVIDKTRESL